MGEIFEKLGGRRHPPFWRRLPGWPLDRLAEAWRSNAALFMAPLIGGGLLLHHGWTVRGHLCWPGIVVFAAGAILLLIRPCQEGLRRLRSVSATREAGGRADIDLESALARLFREKQHLMRQVDDLAAMREVSLAVGSILDFGEMIHAVLDLITAHFGVSRALIYLRGEDEAWLEAVGARAEDRDIPLARILAKRIPIGTGLVGRAAAERRDLMETHAEKGVVAAIPLITKDRVVGVLKLSDADPAAIDARRCHKLHAVAGAIAVALENSRLYRMAVTDGLTGLYVHRHFQLRLEEEFTRSRRYRSPLALLMVDIDHFKNFNDEHGHAIGDFVLKQVARALAEEARATDVVCRYGGEEMAVVCPETDLEGALRIAERIRTRIGSRRYHPDEAARGISVTVSIGVGTAEESMRDRAELIALADGALYEAKRRGRNRVEAAGTDQASAEVA